MKKALLIVVIILAVLLALPVINFVRWTLHAKKPLGIVIVDKTVPTLDREKHKSFNWIMTNSRYVDKESKKSFNYRNGYYGFYPLRPVKLKQWNNVRYDMTEAIQTLPETKDAVYFTDTYGVFWSDWFTAISAPRRPRKLEGAFNGMDNNLVKEMQAKNRLVILEYNAFDWPTAEYESFRLQEKLGIKWTGWTGRYFASLDTLGKNFPQWMTAMYRKQYKKPWTFSKPGIVLLRDKGIIVFEEGSMLTSALPVITTSPEYCEKWGIAESVAFDQWFDIVDPMETSVISKFKLATTPEADSILAGYEGLSSEFPAVVMDPSGQRTFYFSGDFCHTNVPYWTSHFLGLEKMKGMLYSNKPEDLRRFFWLYYKPLIEGIFGDYYNSLTVK